VHVVSILDSIRTTEAGAPRITVYGSPGIGKSTLASKFPRPLFILTEDNELPGVQALPLAQSFTDVWNSVKSLLACEELPFDTIVLDSISKLDSMVVDYILDKEPAGKNGAKAATLTAACGGYGAGYMRAESLHRALKGLLDRFKERGISVVYIAHMAHGTVKPPDNEDYTNYTIVMNHDKSRHVYIDDVDMVLFCKLKSYTSQLDSGRMMIKSTEERVIVTGINDSFVSKNRFAMPSEIPMTFDAISSYVPFYGVIND
jgi:hypothetical protein